MLSKSKNRSMKNLCTLLSIITILPHLTPVTFAVGHRNSQTNSVIRRNIPRTYDIPLKQQNSRRELWRMHILQMPIEAVKEQLNYEIERYKHRAPDVFKIDEKLIQKSDPRGLLINLSTLNYLFDKYSPFTEKFIDFKRNSRNKCFHLFYLKPSKTSPNPYMGASPCLDGIAFVQIKSYKSVSDQVRMSCNDGSFSSRDESQAYESILVHEFGHLISFFYTISKNNMATPTLSSAQLEQHEQAVKKFIEEKLETPEDEKFSKVLEKIGISKREYLFGLYLFNLWSLEPNKRKAYVDTLSKATNVDDLASLSKKFMEENYNGPENEKTLLELLREQNLCIPELRNINALFFATRALKSIDSEKQQEYLNLISDLTKEYERGNAFAQNAPHKLKCIYDFVYEHCAKTPSEKAFFKSLVYDLKHDNIVSLSEKICALNKFKSLCCSEQKTMLTEYSYYATNYPNLETFASEFSKKMDDEAAKFESKVYAIIDGSSEDTIGRYGKFDPEEFIAEAFAHLECSNPKNVSKLGKETERFIVEEMKFLPKERATFPENK